MEHTALRAEVEQILAAHDYRASALIAIMQDVQSLYNYLPERALEQIAKGLNISIAKTYSVATFYENFSLLPKGKNIIRICDGTACHVRKSIPILEAIRGDLGLSGKKQTTDDLLFTVETVSCLGACGLSPVITINDVVHPAMTPEKALELLTELKKEDAAHAEA